MSHRLIRLYRSKQTLILATPGGLIASVSVLVCGWYSDKKVDCTYGITNENASDIDLCAQGERMLPIIFSLMPTIVGAAMLVGLNDSGKKGALLFCRCKRLFIMSVAQELL